MKVKHYVKMIPENILLFRDETSMNKGETNWIVSKCIPYPSVFWGTICTAMLRQKKLSEIQQLIKDGRTDQHEKIKECLKVEFIGVYDGEEEKVYIPAPLDLYYSNKGQVFCGKFQKEQYFLPTKKWVHKTFEQAKHDLISLSDFYYYYLEGDYRAIELKSMEDFFTYETRIGIELEDGIVKESHLYQMQSVCFKKDGCGYVIGYKSGERCEEGYVTLGGERKSAYLTEIENEESFSWLHSLQEKECHGSLIKVIFLTPTIIPEKESFEEIQKAFENKKIQLKNAVIGDTQIVSGFDIATGKSKRKEKVIPAGSILFLQSNLFEKETYKKIAQEIEGVLKEFTELSYRGFGKFLLAEEVQ